MLVFVLQVELHLEQLWPEALRPTSLGWGGSISATANGSAALGRSAMQGLSTVAAPPTGEGMLHASCY